MISYSDFLSFYQMACFWSTVQRSKQTLPWTILSKQRGIYSRLWQCLVKFCWNKGRRVLNTDRENGKELEEKIESDMANVLQCIVLAFANIFSVIRPSVLANWHPWKLDFHLPTESGQWGTCFLDEYILKDCSHILEKHSLLDYNAR